eukprot:Trichotokara_eunicae@DN1605_c0_g1_i1.p1
MADFNKQFDEIGRSFVKVFYDTFQSDRTKLASLFSEQSFMTWENKQQMGVKAIDEFVKSLPFNTVKFQLVTCDCQPSMNNGVLVCTNGDLQIDNEQPLKFCQTFHLQPTGSGSYFLSNVIFRFILGVS